MKEYPLDNELKKIQQIFPELWEQYGFHIRYFTKHQSPSGERFILGLGNKTMSFLFDKEMGLVDKVQFFVGTKNVWFSPPEGRYSKNFGWYSLEELAPLLGNVPTELTDNLEKDVDMLSHYLRSHMAELFELFKDSKALEKNLKSIKSEHGESNE